MAVIECYLLKKKENKLDMLILKAEGKKVDIYMMHGIFFKKRSN